MQHTLPVAKNSVLVVIDVQERLAQAMPPRHVEGNVKRIAKLIRAAQRLRIPTLVTEQYPKGLGNTLPLIEQACGGRTGYIDKLTFDACRCDAFTKAFTETKRTTAVVTGMETHVCVAQTALSLSQRAASVTVVSDAVVSRFSDDHHTALDLLRQSHIQVASFEMVLFSWMEAAGTPVFKELSHMARDRD